MDHAEPKKRLDEVEWKQVSAFVENYFLQRENAAKATYAILFRQISQQYPHIVLQQKTFKRRVASIEELKRRAGIQIRTEDLTIDHRSKLKDKFLQELIHLPLDKLECIRFGELIQRVHTNNPDLKVGEIPKSTLAYHFRLKELKDLARGQRPAETPVPRAHSVHAPHAAPAPPPPRALAAAAGSDGLRFEEDPRFLGAPARISSRTRPNRYRDVFDPSGGSEECEPEPGLSAQSVESVQPEGGGAGFAVDFTVDVGHHCPAGSQSAACRETNVASASGGALAMILDYSSEEARGISTSEAGAEFGM